MSALDALHALRAHPLVDALGDRVAVSGSVGPVVPLTPLRADLLLTAVAARRAPVLVTPASAGLTEPLHDALVAAHGAWVVEPDVGTGWNGLTGAVVRDPARATGPAAAGAALAAPFLAGDPDADAVRVEVRATLRHRDPTTARVGEAVETICAAIGAEPTGWGVHEPLERRWSRSELASWALAAPPGVRALVRSGRGIGSLALHRTRFGAEEAVQVALTTALDDREHVGKAVQDALRSLPAMPLFALALARRGRADGTVRPFLPGAPGPLALLIGPPGVRDLGLDVAALVDDLGAERVGRPRVPGLLLPTSGGPEGWDVLERLVEHAGRERVAAALGLRLPERGTPPRTA